MGLKLPADPQQERRPYPDADCPKRRHRKNRGVEMGADDNLPNHSTPAKLIARIKAILRVLRGTKKQPGIQLGKLAHD
jgi:DNA-binding response OmpR family regulator